MEVIAGTPETNDIKETAKISSAPIANLPALKIDAPNNAIVAILSSGEEIKNSTAAATAAISVSIEEILKR